MDADLDPRTQGEPEHRFEEGKEAPPPGVRAMAVVRWILLALVATAALFSVYSYARPLLGGDTKSAEKGAKYICPMHTQIVSDRPGECPICHMDLVPAPAVSTPAAPPPSATTTYTQGYICPMDPDVHSDTPGTCSRCKMDLVPVPGWTPGAPAASAKAAPSAAPTPSANPAAPRGYTCPMHPDVRTQAPGRCPHCGMELEAIPEPKPPSAPPDTAPITLSLDRVQAIGVRTAVVEEQRGEGGLRLTAAVEVPEQGRAEVHVRAAGYVEAIHVKDVGVKVKAGEALVSVYSPEVLQAQQELLAMSAWPAVGVDRREPPTAAAKKRLELLGVGRETIERIVAGGKPQRAMAIGSPIGGYVTRKDVVLGSYAMPDKVLFEVADLKGVYLVASAYPHQLAAVRVGDEATFTTPSLPGHVFSTKVDLVYPSMDVSTRTARVRFRVDNKDLNLRPGQFGIVQIAGKHVHALMIPMDAVIDTGRSIYVFVAREGGRFEARNVELGEQIGARFIVKSGLAEGERVVSGATFLIDAESRLQASLAASSGKAP